MSINQTDIEKLCSMIKQARSCAVLTGAGVSTLSGIRDFRGKNGLYTEMDDEKLFDLRYFFTDPSFYYEYSRDFIYNIDEKDASIVHTCLGKWEQQGLIKGIVTQNIDLLHQKGGSRNVIEIHGSPSIHYCTRCISASDVEMINTEERSLYGGCVVAFPEVSSLVRSGKMPKCEKCGGVLKPAITFFGENLPANALRKAEKLAKESDLMLILGTSLTVFPAAGLPEYTLQGGGKIVIVNNMVTNLDSHAALHFDDLEAVFDIIENLL
jgi:NAD-dependent deacetylase